MAHSSEAAHLTTPITVSVDTGAWISIKVTCQKNVSIIPSSVSIRSFVGQGALFQQLAGRSSVRGSSILIFPAALQDHAGRVIYQASFALQGALDRFNYSCVCGAVVESGSVVVLVTAGPMADVSTPISALKGRLQYFYLRGTGSTHGSFKATVTALPTQVASHSPTHPCLFPTGPFQYIFFIRS